MSEEQVADLEAGNGTLPGISPTEMTRLREMIPRIHGIRAAVILAGQLRQHGDVGSLAQDLVLMQKAQNDELDDVLNLRKAWEAYRKRAKLQEAVVALNAMSLQVASVFEPVLNFAAGKVTGLQHQMQKHQGLTRDIAIGGAAFVGAIGLGRMFGLGRLPGINRIPGVRGLLGGSLGSRLSAANAAQAAMSGNPAIGASPQNPIYVVVVSQLFGGGTPSPIGAPGGGPGGGGGGGNFWGAVGKNALRYGGPVAIAAGITQGIASVAPKQLGYGPFQRGFWDFSLPGEGSKGEGISNLERARRALVRNPSTPVIPGSPEIRFANGQQQVTLNINLKNPDGTQQSQRVHIPLTTFWNIGGSLWSGGRSPSTGGIPKTTRGG